MDGEPIDLRVAGHSYRVVSSADRATLERLASIVEERLTQMVGHGRPAPVQSLLLVAMALARDVEAERERTKQAERRARDMLTTVLARIDAALDSVDENGEPLPLCHGGPEADGVAQGVGTWSSGGAVSQK